MTQAQVSNVANGQPLLDIRGLHKQYGAVEVLKGVDLSMQRGNVVTLIGSSGSGKTTLLRCVNMLEEFQAGRSCSTASPSVMTRSAANACATRKKSSPAIAP